MTSILVAAAITVIPGLLLLVPEWYGWITLIQKTSLYILFPGLAMDLLLTGGRLTDLYFTATFIESGIFYSGLIYMVLAIRSRRQLQPPGLEE